MLSDGRKIPVESTWGNEGDIMRLDVDPTNHPAWRNGQSTFINVNNEGMVRFMKKYGAVFS
jgi:large subunit ribosomal protein L31